MSGASGGGEFFEGGEEAVEGRFAVGGGSVVVVGKSEGYDGDGVDGRIAEGGTAGELARGHDVVLFK